MQPITLEYSADILAGIGMTAMPSLFAMGDKLAHVLRVRVKAGGEPVDLTGWTVTASVVRQDQATVMMAGRAVGDAAEVTLEAPCYSQSGGFTLSVAIGREQQLITIFCGRGDVTRTRTDSLVDPGHTIPSVDEIIAQYGLMKTAVQNTDAAAKRADDAASNAQKVANDVQKKLDNGEFVGAQGPKGEKGDTGETPVITVAEDTPLSYKLHFQTSEQELTTPNLFAPFTEYYVDLSAADSTLNIPLKDLILTYQRASASALRISIAPKNTAAPVLVDLRRTTIYDGSTIETQTLNGSSISASIAIDGTVYTNSQETHNMRIRQQDPVTKLWSMCEINSFLSAGGARCSIRIQWSEYDVAYAAPTV